MNDKQIPQADRIRDMAVQIFDCAARGHNGKDPVPNCPACGPLAKNRPAATK